MSTRRKRPRKPVPPASQAVLPKAGPARIEIEVLPENQEDLETTIVRKFIGALRHFEGRTLILQGTDGVWPDALATEGESSWAIELVEVVDPRLAKCFRLRDDYLTALHQSLGGSTPSYLSGVEVQILDDQQTPPFPAVSRQGGQKLVQRLASELLALKGRIRELPVGGSFIHKTGFGPPNPGLLVIRDGLEGTPGRLRFQTGIAIAPSRQRRLLAETVARKMTKRYGKPQKRGLILLAYELHLISVLKGGEEIDLAREVLEAAPHPFTEVWYLYPYPHEPLGHLVRIWPPDP